MIDRLPGWLNYFVLQYFYVLLIGINVGIAYLLYRLLGPLGVIILLIAKDYAGGYLSKWRETLGGGWKFW